MAISVNYNPMSMNAFNAFKKNRNALDKNSEKLASGLRINRAADDVAGLSISEKMRGQIRGLHQASRNAQDGISLIQTAEGAMQEVHEILGRMGELGVQAANGTLNDKTDRKALEQELVQLKKEINRIADKTTFNGIKIFAGGVSSSTGSGSTGGSTGGTTGSGSTGGTTGSGSTGGSTGSGSTGGSGSASSISYVPTIKQNINEGIPGDKLTPQMKETLIKQVIPNAVDKIVKAFPHTFSYLRGTKVGIALRGHEDIDGNYMAAVNINVGNLLMSDGIKHDYIQLSLNINIAKIAKDGTPGHWTNFKDIARNELESVISHEMMHALMATSLTAGMNGWGPGIEPVGMFPDWFKEGSAELAGGGADRFFSMGLKKGMTENQIENILSANKNSIFYSGNGPHGSQEAKYGTGYLACMYLGSLIGGGESSKEIANGFDILMHRIAEGQSFDTAIKEFTKYTSFKEFEKNFAKDATKFVSKIVEQSDGGYGSIVASSLKDKDFVNDSNFTGEIVFDVRSDMLNVRNFFGDNMVALKGGGSYKANKDKDGNAPPSTPSIPAVKSRRSKAIASPIVNKQVANSAKANKIKLNKAKSNKVKASSSQALQHEQKGWFLQVGANSGQAIYIKTQKINTNALGLKDISFSTQQLAEQSISKIQAAVNVVSGHRAYLGVIQNRLEHTIKNLDVNAENTQAAESRIRDTDMAKEMASYVKHNILMQSAQAMLAQANFQPQKVLQLLAG